MDYWICGMLQSGNGDEVAWTFQGLFSSKEKAIAACSTEKYFIAPVELDVDLGPKITEFKGGYFPLWPGGDPRCLKTE